MGWSYFGDGFTPQRTWTTCHVLIIFRARIISSWLSWQTRHKFRSKSPFENTSGIFAVFFDTNAGWNWGYRLGFFHLRTARIQRIVHRKSSRKGLFRKNQRSFWTFQRVILTSLEMRVVISIGINRWSASSDICYQSVQINTMICW